MEVPEIEGLTVIILIPLLTLWYHSVIMDECKFADRPCDVNKEPICGYYGNILCFNKSTPCTHFEEKDTLDKIVEVLDCIPTCSSDWSI